MFYFREWLLLAIAMFFATAVDLAAAVEFSINGDVRTSFFSLHREDRDGRESSTHEFRVRPRVGIGAKLYEQWRMQVRFAGRYSTDGSKFYFEIFDSIPAQDGLRQGDATLDEIYVEYRRDSAWEIRAAAFRAEPC